MENKEKLFEDIFKNETEFSDNVMDTAAKYAAKELSAEEAMKKIIKSVMLYGFRRLSHCSKMDEDED